MSLAWLMLLVLTQPANVPGPADVVMLDDYGPCGLTSLYVVCKIRGVPVEWERLKELVGPAAPDGSHSFADLSRAAAAVGMHPVGLHATPRTLHGLPMPAIVQVHNPQAPGKPAHLLVLLRPEPDGVSLLDPPYPAFFLTEAPFSHIWTGNILVFAADEAEAKRIRGSTTLSQALHPLTWVWLAVGILAGLILTSRRWLPSYRKGMEAVPLSLRRRVRPVMGAGIAVAACGLVFGYWLLADRNPTTAAQCLFDKPLIDLGELPPGKLTYTVPVRNGGTVPLRISKVLSSCTCAVVKAPEMVEPGRTDILEIALNIPPGPQGARITIESNDPEGPKTVMLHWHGKATPKLIPFKIEARSLPTDRPYERTIQIVYPGGKSALVPQLERCECNSPLVGVRTGKNDPLAARFARTGLLTQVLGEQELHVKVQPPAEPGLFTAKCKLHLKCGETVTSLDLPIWLEFNAGELTLEVSGVIFSAARAEDLQGQERHVRVLDAVPDSELIVPNVPAWLECSITQKSEDGPAVRLRVVKPPPEPLVHYTLHIKRAQDSGSLTPLRVSVFAPTR